jgi:hypothetical protein
VFPLVLLSRSTLVAPWSCPASYQRTRNCRLLLLLLNPTQAASAPQQQALPSTLRQWQHTFGSTSSGCPPNMCAAQRWVLGLRAAAPPVDLWPVGHSCAQPSPCPPSMGGMPAGGSPPATAPPSRTHSHSNMLAALSVLTDRPPSLADLLGPYFLLLTTPQAADATLQVWQRGGGGSEGW